MNLNYHLDQPCRSAPQLRYGSTPLLTEKLVQQIEKGNCFIIVELGHLEYECGLLMQLTLLDYFVEPVEMEREKQR